MACIMLGINDMQRALQFGFTYEVFVFLLDIIMNQNASVMATNRIHYMAMYR